MASEDDGWSGDSAARWVRESARAERRMVPVSDVLFAAAGLRPGERVIDVGCGTGPTTRQAAGIVGEHGWVTGVDISRDLLAAAAAATAGGQIDWVLADVASWTPAVAAYDVVISRFGVIFFADPAAAFRNLAAAVRPGGRLAMAVWGSRTGSPLFEVPLQAALGVLSDRGIPEPDGLSPYEGPFVLGDTAATTQLLKDVGWRDVRFADHMIPLPLGNGMDARAAAQSAADFGQSGLVVTALGDDGRAAAVDAMAADLAHHVDEYGHVVLDGHVLIMTALRD